MRDLVNPGYFVMGFYLPVCYPGSMEVQSYSLQFTNPVWNSCMPDKPDYCLPGEYSTFIWDGNKSIPNNRECLIL